MDPNETLTAPQVEGVPAETGSQEAQPETQVPAESQQPAIARVESNVNTNQPQAHETQRPRPSDFVRERQRMRNLEETLRSQSQRMEEMAALLKAIQPKPDVSAEQQFDVNTFWTNPNKILTDREKKIFDELQTLKQEFSGLKNQKVNADAEQSARDGLDMLFPKSSPDADEPLEDRIEDPERRELLDKFLKANPVLDKLFRMDPKSGAELILLKLNQQKPSASPRAIPKSLMGSTARGNPSGGAKQKVAAEDLMSELKKLSTEADKNPRLRFDSDHKKRREQLMRDIDRLAQEKRG